MRHRGYRPVLTIEQIFYIFAGLISRWWELIFRKRKKPTTITKVETNIFDKEETYENCTVQVLTNTVTGEVSVGWWRNSLD